MSKKKGIPNADPETIFARQTAFARNHEQQRLAELQERTAKLRAIRLAAAADKACAC